MLVVHGWNGGAAHDADRQGAFSHLIDLTANQVGTVSARSSLIGQLQDMAGTAVYTFDYRRYSDRWVTDPHIAPALASAIDCLYQATGQKLIVVAHSMGGLAVEATFDRRLPGADKRSSEIAEVITVGTPYKGSLLASIAQDAIPTAAVASLTGGPAAGGAFMTLTTAILAACGRLSTIDAEGTCAKIGFLSPVTSLYSDAAIALRYDSSQIRALPTIPSSVKVLQLGGINTFDTGASWFQQLLGAAKTVNLGDTIVTQGSSMPNGTQGNSVTCKYTASPVSAAADDIGMMFRVVSAVDARHVKVPFVDASIPCAHGQLTQDIEVTNTVLGEVHDAVHARVTTMLSAAAESALTPPICGAPRLHLTKGAVVMPGTNGNGGEEVSRGWSWSGETTYTPATALADGRSQMSTTNAGAIAISFDCSASGAGGAYNYVGIYTNKLRLIGVIDPTELTTAGGAGLPGVASIDFVKGEARAQVEWLAFAPSGNYCPKTRVELDYSLSPTTTGLLTHGPVRTVFGDPRCGAR